MKRWMMVAALVVLLGGVGVLHAAPLHQSSTLDQDNENDDVDTASEGNVQQAQTFTAGRSGVLDRIEVRGRRTGQGGQVGVQITSVTQDGTPTSTVLGSGSFDSRDLPTSSAGDWVAVSINPAIQVMSGVQYALVLSPGLSYPFSWRSSRGNQYSRGKVYDYSRDINMYDDDDDRDYFFRTYVLSPPPSTTPTCFGQTATIYVKDGTIVGGKDNGKPYKGTLKGTSAVDVMVGTDGKDSIAGSDKNDLICGLGGNDTIHGNDGNDRIDGGSGNDTIYGDDGADMLHGGDGDDRLFGGSGNDSLYGDTGNDTLKGESGTDAFDGGAGTDTVTDYDPKKGETEVNIL